MSLYFESLGKLSSFLETRNYTVVDPPIPLTDLASNHSGLWASQPSVRKVVGFIARSVSTIPLHVYERVSDTDRQRVTNHELARIAKQPAPLVTAHRFWERLLIDGLLYDRWLAQKVLTLNNELELVRIPPRLWKFEADGLDRVQSVLINTDGRWVSHDPTKFIFDHGYATRGANGTSPAETLSALLAEASEAVAYRRSVWKSHARIPTVLERPATAPQWSPEARTRFSRSWQNFIRGGGNEGGTPILEDGMTLKTVEAFKPQETNDLENRKLTDAEVAQAYFIKPELLGIREGNYSNIESLRRSLYRDDLGPYILAWEQALNAMLTPDLAGGRDLYIEANVEAKLRGSFEEQAQLLQSAVGAPWMLRSEARGRMNLPEIEGTDELVVPLNVLVGGLASPRDTAPKHVEPLTKAADDNLGTVERERDALEDDLAAYQKQLAETVMAGLHAKAAGPLNEAFDLVTQNMLLKTLIAGRVMRIARAAAAEVLDQWNPDREGWDAEVMDPWLIKAAETNATNINQAIYDELAEAVTDSEWETETESVLTRNGWALMLAVTLATEAAGFGRHDAATASKLTSKTWLTQSTNPRPEHAALNGLTIPIDAYFAVGGRYPGDPMLLPEQTVNCKCVVAYGRDL